MTLNRCYTLQVFRISVEATFKILVDLFKPPHGLSESKALYFLDGG